MRSTTAGRLLLASFAMVATVPSVRAEDAIKPGKWEYTVTMQMANVPQLPPGVQPPSNVQARSGAGGMTVTHTSCMNAGDPTAELRKPHGPPGAPESQCKVERMEHSGATIRWASSCITADATVHTEGSARYDGDRMEANFTTRTTRAGGAPIEASQHVVGRYLGPCETR